MQMMRAVTLKGFGNPDVLQISRIPKVSISKPTDVLIKVMAAGVNRGDASQRRGLYPPPKGCSEILGVEVSGMVEQVGKEVTKVKEGDRVMALLPGGGYADYAVSHFGSVMHIPHGFSFIEAAAIPEAFLTAWQILKLHAQVQKGQHVLIHAGASGVGTAISQLVEKYFEATAITTSSPSKVEVCKNFASINLDRTPDETGLSFSPKIKTLLGDGAVNAVVDCIFGGSYISEDAAVLAQDGKIIITAFLGGARVHINCLTLFRQRANIIFSKLRCQSDEYKKELVDSFEREIIPFFQERVISPVANKTYEIEEVIQAHNRLDDHKSWGRVVLSLHRSLKQNHISPYVSL